MIKFIVISIFLGLWLGMMIYGRQMSLPAGISMLGHEYRVRDVAFFYDVTFKKGEAIVREQQIFDRILTVIDQAQRFVLLDMFLVNSEYDRGPEYPQLAARLVAKLIDKKLKNPALDIVLISDEINTHYGSAQSVYFNKLKEHGIAVIITDNTRLRDSNFIYSALWRLLGQGLSPQGHGWLPSPFSKNGEKMTLSAYLRLLNFKANHRKLVASEKTLLVTSANPHDASAHHSNIAFVVDGPIVADAVAGERAVARFSATDLPSLQVAAGEGQGEIAVRLISEGKIKARLLAALAGCGPKSVVKMAMFYLSEQEVVKALISAAERGAEIRLLLDPNKDAFGRQRNGIPNRPIANYLVKNGRGNIQVRWYATHGEQFHSKLTLISMPEQAVIIGGSANLTRRNIADLNLESCLEIKARSSAKVVAEVDHYFDRLWQNLDGEYSLPFADFEDTSLLRYRLALFCEWSGISTF
ncbi:MAG: phospholipase D family protein [Desulfobulbaceae bacterium]|nr:phospholipase D family protein [Desulfobulbaceae bacterium]HIJ79967.1 phospholipase [Deltaproteobacteria bacterium]